MLIYRPDKWLYDSYINRHVRQSVGKINLYFTPQELYLQVNFITFIYVNYENRPENIIHCQLWNEATELNVNLYQDRESDKHDTDSVLAIIFNMK